MLFVVGCTPQDCSLCADLLRLHNLGRPLGRRRRHGGSRTTGDFLPRSWIDGGLRHTLSTCLLGRWRRLYKMCLSCLGYPVQVCRFVTPTCHRSGARVSSSGLLRCSVEMVLHRTCRRYLGRRTARRRGGWSSLRYVSQKTHLARSFFSFACFLINLIHVAAPVYGRRSR